MTQEYDAIIVGGGPAGLAAALVLAQSGARLLVLERKPGPVDKVCGEGIMPPGLACLRRLGVWPVEAKTAGGLTGALVDDLPGLPFRGIQYVSPRGRVARATFAEGPGRGLRRLELARLLEARVAELGVEIRRTSFRDFTREGDRLAVRTDDETLTTRLLIGADGLHSRVRRKAGLAGPPAKNGRWGARRHYRVAPWSPYVEVYWRREGEAYVTPVGPNEIGVALLWNPRRLRTGRDDPHATMLALFPELAARLHGAEILSERKATGPLRQRTAGSVADGVLLLGDAAGYLDALTGEGLSLAFEQALALDESLGPVLARGRGPIARGELTAFARAQGRITGPYYRMTGAVLLLHRFPWLQEPAVSLLARFPEFFRYLLSLNMGMKRFL